jgi:two-component system sensor histidine kinase QseC
MCGMAPSRGKGTYPPSRRLTSGAKNLASDVEDAPTAPTTGVHPGTGGEEDIMAQKITPYLWFDADAEEAVAHYVSLFPDSRVTKVARWGKGAPFPEGSVMNVAFELAGQAFLALNGGPHHRFTPAISLFVSCRDQRETDRIWDAILAHGGKAVQCGWIEDRYGVSWQIIPDTMVELLGDPDPRKAGRVAQALMGMQKVDVAALERAYAG